MFKGSIVALVTPFTEEGVLDLPALRRLVQWHLESGTDAISCCGTTGEAPTLSHEEQMLVTKTVLEEVKGRVPVIAGTGTYSTAETVKKTEEVKKLGAEGCLVIFPYYNRPSPAGCLAHFREISRVGLPVILYNHPGRTGLKPSPELLAEIALLPSMAAIKDATGSLEMMQSLKKLTSIPILSGDDSLALPMMELGAVGVMSVVANIIPREWQQVIEKRDYETYHHYATLCEALVLENNPQVVKYALKLMGKCSSYLRLPLVEPQPKTKERIQQALQTLPQEILSGPTFSAN